MHAGLPTYIHTYIYTPPYQLLILSSLSFKHSKIFSIHYLISSTLIFQHVYKIKNMWSYIEDRDNPMFTAKLDPQEIQDCGNTASYYLSSSEELQWQPRERVWSSSTTTKYNHLLLVTHYLLFTHSFKSINNGDCLIRHPGNPHCFC